MDAWRFSGKSAEVKPKMLIYFILFYFALNGKLPVKGSFVQVRTCRHCLVQNGAITNQANAAVTANSCHRL
jgi:hypothetical protein